jgi:ABC-type sugar transport system ATPase subunit
MRNHPRLELQNVAVRFGKEVGIAALSLDVAAGETVAVVGASGAGKSSLLRAVAGLDPIAGGRISIDGVDRTGTPAEERGAVYLHQSPLLFPHLTVGENVAFPLRVRRQPRKVVQERVGEVLEALGLHSFRDRAPGTLSGGQRHRVALARAIAGRPAVLLLDEPLTGLDGALRAEALEAIRLAAAQYDPAILYVTHDLAEAGAIADRIGVLVDGALQQVVPPEQLFNTPGSIAVAELVGFSNRLDGSSDGSSFTCDGLPILIPTRGSGPAVLLFRPQALTLAAAGEIDGAVIAVSHAPSGPRLRVRIGGRDLEATVPTGSATPTPGLARFHLDQAAALLFPSEVEPARDSAGSGAEA